MRRVLVTGANRGIGRATVGAILAAEDDVFVLLGSRSVERGEEAREEIGGDRVEVVQIDVSDDDSVVEAASRVGSEPLYGVVNNAGVGGPDFDMRTMLNINTRGPRRVCEAFLPMIDGGRIVNVSSASGPNFVSQCDAERQELLTSPDVTWEEIEALMEEAIAIAEGDGDFAAAGLGDGSAYGLSKACLNAYTIALAREHPELTINACTPGYIETDMTRPHAEKRGVTPEELGMKSPEEGTRAQMRLLFGEPGGSGWYFGSDAERSPLDRYRSPGDPPYTGD